mmetsp:Transcript_32562/g.66477  ORF Transcript_32562/g.66477 Transcript_32562/m.66477 type:complete len:331 (+) Transcript_32562:49-1041(+)
MIAQRQHLASHSVISTTSRTLGRKFDPVTRTRANLNASRMTPTSQRPLSLESTSVHTIKNSAQTSVEGEIETAYPLIERHGPGDGVITLNVGGKNFHTLRSTVSQNAVLMDLVMRAEKNCETTPESNAIFVDRDPKHFGMILNHLRNRADGIHLPSTSRSMLNLAKPTATGKNQGRPGRNAKSMLRGLTPTSHALSPESHIHLPKDSLILAEMYFEAVHYQIPELSDRICSKQGLTRIFQFFGSQNPFQMAATAMVTGKRMLAVMGTLATGLGGWAYAQVLTAKQKMVSKSDKDVGDGEEIQLWDVLDRSLKQYRGETVGTKNLDLGEKR